MSKNATKKQEPSKPTIGGTSVFDMLASIDQAAEADGAIRVQLSEVAPDPEQPRKEYDEQKLANLAESIAKFGLVQPITVRRTGGIPAYVIVAGERRWRAARLANLTEIPVFLRDDLADDSEKRSLVQLIENRNRADLSDFEVAQKIQELIDTSPDPSRFGLKAEIARSLDMKPDQISRLLAMLNPDSRALVEAGLIVSADALTRFRGCPADLQAQLLEEARESGEPVTVGAIRAAKAAKAAAVVAPPPADSAAAGQGIVAPGPTGDASQGKETADDSGNLTSTPQGGQAQGAEADQGALPAGDNEDDEEEGASDAGAAGHHAADQGVTGGTSTPTTGGSSPSSTPRAKSVNVATTGEGVEILLRYLVDKSQDKLEVRLPADLAIAVIENLKGEVPENPEQFGQRIKDLLAEKLAT